LKKEKTGEESKNEIRLVLRSKAASQSNKYETNLNDKRDWILVGYRPQSNRLRRTHPVVHSRRFDCRVCTVQSRIGVKLKNKVL